MIVNRKEFVRLVRIDQSTLDIWLEEEWLLPNQDRIDIEFSEADLARAIFIQELTGSLGVNDEGVGIILNLVDQLHGVRRVLSAVLPTTARGRDISVR